MTQSRTTYTATIMDEQGREVEDFIDAHQVKQDGALFTATWLREYSGLMEESRSMLLGAGWQVHVKPSY